MSNPHNPGDGQHVVIQNGQRVSGTLSEEEAKQRAAAMNDKLQESAQQVPEDKRATVKQNLCG